MRRMLQLLKLSAKAHSQLLNSILKMLKEDGYTVSSGDKKAGNSACNNFHTVLTKQERDIKFLAKELKKAHAALVEGKTIEQAA